MPTQHVQPTSDVLLQHVADSVLKARKVVVVTGAGISTNSGIPDFRSENGLYSLIQAQFDAAARRDRQIAVAARTDSDTDEAGTSSGLDEEDRPRKRRKLSGDSPGRVPEPEPELPTKDAIEVKDEIHVHDQSSITVQQEPLSEASLTTSSEEHDEIIVCGSKTDNDAFSTPQPKRSFLAVQPPTSPLSSPPPDDFLIPPSAFQKPRHLRLTDVSFPPSSSPLSSPPPVLFDPFSSSPPGSSPSRRSSTEATDLDDEDPPGASQTSLPGKTTLPNMKGKDLFDASIWADPLRTSVFYTFATSLRQKVKNIEPTTSHRFISHLRDRGKLVRCYTQNIDQIEEKVGLSTSLKDGPGNKGRFSRRSTANALQLSKMVEEVSASDANPSSSENATLPSSQCTAGSSQQSQTSSGETSATDQAVSSSQNNRRSPPPRSGVECVFLHGSLELLRCFLCGRVCSWDDSERELETLSGQQPECPHCVGATVAREEKGKRALGVGKLRPDIVLYGEEHPNAHLISPIVTHDLSLYPDMMLILGTSLRVHGLKVMVREFAKTVHSKGGKVVFVNFTKPPESSWGDIIDYWVEWDCDAWVDDLQSRVPRLWQDPEPPRPKKKRESSGSALEDGTKQEKKRPPPAYPVAMRDTKVTGAYWTMKIMKELHRITDAEPVDRRASLPVAGPPAIVESTIKVAADHVHRATKGKAKRPRKSAPGALERPKKPPSTLNPNHGRSRKTGDEYQTPQQDPTSIPVATPTQPTSPLLLPDGRSIMDDSPSILSSVKLNPRVRKRKKIDGQEIEMPKVGNRQSGSKLVKADLKLAPLDPQPPTLVSMPFGRPPQPVEPRSPPRGPPSRPLMSISPNLRSAGLFGRQHAFFLDDPFTKSQAQRHFLEYPEPQKDLLQKPPRRRRSGRQTRAKAEQHVDETEGGLGGGNEGPRAEAAPALKTSPIGVEGLSTWGSSWKCQE